MYFSYTIFPVKKNKCWNNFKIVRKFYLIILSIHILKLEISGCDNIPAKQSLGCPHACALHVV
jgi:hypothetical protein